MNPILRHIFISLIATFIVAQTFAQVQTKEEAEAYTRVITARADKIVKTLDIDDKEMYGRVLDVIVDQYRNLSALHDSADARIKTVKDLAEMADEKKKKRVDAIQRRSDKSLQKLHKDYLAKLSRELSASNVDKVKDGMTYGVLPITYKGYLEMLPDLSEDQKKQIMTFLVEARERAMDAGSSEEKHAWFGKYKGKINNYLSAAGYDLKKAGEDWQRRREARKS